MSKIVKQRKKNHEKQEVTNKGDNSYVVHAKVATCPILPSILTSKQSIMAYIQKGQSEAKITTIKKEAAQKQ